MRTIDQWREAIEVAPEAVAAQFHAMVRMLPDALRRATLAQVLPEGLLAERFSAGRGKGFLGGVPYMVKDLFDTVGWPTRAGSVFLEDIFEVPSCDAGMITRMNDLNAVLAGKTQLVEFAYGMSGENPHYGDCPHPSLTGTLAGGSSSGSAWAVGSGLVPLAFGTDTAGSIRVPAAFCGLWGLRLAPQYWMEGVFPLAPSFDTLGWFTSTATDMRLLCERWFPLTGKSRRARALYVTGDVPFGDAALEAACNEVAVVLRAEEDQELARWLGYGWEESAQAYVMLSSHEAAREHAEWLDVMRGRYDPVVWGRLDKGRRWTSAELDHAGEVRAEVTKRFKGFFDTYDALVRPITPLPSPEKSQMTEDFRDALLRLNAPVSLAGLPALTVPVRLPDGRTGGLQIAFPGLEHMDIAPWLERVENRG